MSLMRWKLLGLSSPSTEIAWRCQHIQSPDPWQNDLKFRPRTRRAVKIEPTAQTVRHDVVEEMQAKGLYYLDGGAS